MMKTLNKQELSLVNGGEDFMSYPEALNKVGRAIGKGIAEFVCGLNRMRDAVDKSGYGPSRRVNQKDYM